eukprot:606350-Prymnesium_polylepis.1
MRARSGGSVAAPGRRLRASFAGFYSLVRDCNLCPHLGIWASRRRGPIAPPLGALAGRDGSPASRDFGSLDQHLMHTL